MAGAAEAHGWLMVSAARIDRLTDRIIAYRFWRYYKRKYEERRLADMALELKGLKAKAMVARANIGDLDKAYDDLNAATASHASDVRGLKEQVGYMADDLSFATAALGNSVAASNASTEAVQPPQPPPVTFTLDPAKVIEQPPAAPQPSILNGSPGMRSEYQAARADVQLIRS
jgi:hypothetical protein